MEDYAVKVVLLCFFAGFFLGSFYSLLKIMRILFGLKAVSTAVLDIAFMAVAAVVTFLLAFALDFGRLRFYQLALQAMGFAVFMMSIDPFLEYPARKVYIIVTKISRYLAKKYQYFVGRFKKKRPSSRKNTKKPLIFRKKTKKGLAKFM